MRNQAAVALLCPEIAMNPIAISEASREGHLYLLILDLDNRFFDFVAAAMRTLNTGNCIDLCRRPSAVVNLNCVTNRFAQGPRYKLSYDAEQ
jgi:hypothetical protein